MIVPKRLRGTASQQQETDAARRFGGRRRGSARKFRGDENASGGQRADVHVPGFARIECKTTKHRSFRVTADMLAKLAEATFGSDEIGFLEVEIQGVGRVYVIPDWAMERIIEYCDATAKPTE